METDSPSEFRIKSIGILWDMILRTVIERKVPSIIYNKPTRCNSGSIVFIKNYKYALHK